jgi:hypothetical protein
MVWMARRTYLPVGCDEGLPVGTGVGVAAPIEGSAEKAIKKATTKT